MILVKKEVSTMRVFFETLQKCDIVPSDAKVALLEFDAGTTVDDWLVRGKELLEEEQFKMSASCFKAAGEAGLLTNSTKGDALNLILT